MRKIAGILIVVLLASLVFTGCFNNISMVGGNEELIGEWERHGTLSYTFNRGGTGIRAGEDIRWTTNDETLFICWSPESCGNSCIAPERWDYVLEDNELTISRGRDTFTYTRR